MFSPLIDQLIFALKRLPGVGPKSAQRIALHLLERDRESAAHLAESLAKAVDAVMHCRECRTLTELPVCGLCSNAKRDATILCVVETPADILALEQSASFQGKYFVLHGKLSPIDGLGPKEIGLHDLEKRMALGVIKEIIVATNPSLEGEATAHYIHDKAQKYGVTVSRIAHGVPMGGELEYIDGGTLALALNSRKVL